MKTEIKEISQSVRELQVNIEASEATKEYNIILNKIKKMVVIPGFRKGKAPNSKIEQQYHDYIKEEFYNQKIGEYYKKALDELDISPINQGEATDIKWEKGQDLIVTYKFEIFPEITLNKYKDLEIPYEEVEFKDDMIDNTLEDFREKMADEVDAESNPEDGDLLNITIYFLDENGEKTKEIERNIALNDNQYSKTFNNNISKLKAGEEIKTKLFTQKQKSEDNDIDDSLKNNEFIVKVNTIKHKVLPEINDEFAKDLEYDSLEDMKKKIETELKNNVKNQNASRKREAILAKLVEENDFEVPQSMVRNYAESMAKPAAESYKIDIKQVIPMYMQMAEFNLKSHYIMEEIKKQNEIKVEDSDKEEMIKEAAENLKIDVEKYKQLYKKQIESPDFNYSIEEKKILSLIENSSNFVPYPKEQKDSPEKKEDK